MSTGLLLARCEVYYKILAATGTTWDFHGRLYCQLPLPVPRITEDASYLRRLRRRRRERIEWVRRLRDVDRLSFAEIGGRLAVSRARVYQLYNSPLKTLAEKRETER